MFIRVLFKSCSHRALLYSVAFFATATATQSQATPSAVQPELTLLVNSLSAPTVYQGWPAIFQMRLNHPDADDPTGNLMPISINTANGSWVNSLQLFVADANGNVQSWPIVPAFQPDPSQTAISLGAGVESNLLWTVSPAASSSLSAGTYQAAVVLNTQTNAAPGTFSGAVQSNIVTITIAAEPSPLSSAQQEEKYSTLAAYDLTQGNNVQALADIQTLLSLQPTDIAGLMEQGDLLMLAGQPQQALASYDQALAAFTDTTAFTQEPPVSIISKQNSARAGFMSQAGLIGTPQIAVNTSNTGAQSPGIVFVDLTVTNSGTGTAPVTYITQFSFNTVSGSGQVAYDAMLSPSVPLGIDELTPGASTTVRVYLDIPSGVSQFSVSLSGVTSDAVGTLSNFNTTQTIMPTSSGGAAPLIISAANLTQQYGQATPNLNNVTYSGFVNGDTPASLSGTLICNTTATSGSPVGTYPITCSGQTSANYVITYVPGSLTITPGPLTLTAADVMRSYGAPNPPLTGATATGFVNGDSLASLAGTLLCTTTASPSSSVGSYPISCSGLTSPNYSITFAPGLLTIGPAPLTIAANNGTRAFGQANPAFNNVTSSGFVNADSLASLSGTLICTTPATQASPAGAYSITCSGLSSPNYSITFLPGTLTVTSDVLTVTASNATRQYGQPNPPLNDVTYAGFVNGDTPASLSGTLICATSATGASSVGTYPINCSGLSSPNYAISFVPGVLTLTPAPLVIAANNSSRPYGANNPLLGGTLSGLQNSDPITTTFATTAAPTSPVGSYPIIPTALDPANRLSNYNVSLVNGTLSVVPEGTSLAVSVWPASIAVDQSATVTVTLSAPDMVIPIDQAALAPFTLTSPIPTDVLSNNGMCAPTPSTTPGIATCSLTITSIEPNGRTLNASFPGSANLMPSAATANLIVTAVLQSQPSCIRSDFRNVAVPGGSTIWFNSIFKVREVGQQLFHVSFYQSTVQFQYTDASGNLVNVNQSLPDAHITIDPNATQASTSFDPLNNLWLTSLPFDLDDNAFLTGMPWLVPAGGIPGDIEPVTVCGTFASDVAGIDIGWRWAAAAYSTFGADGSTAGVKPMDTDHDNQGTNHDHAGTPENYKQFLIPGARGKGNKNFTGSYSGSAVIE